MQIPQELQKIARVFNTDKIITPEDINAVLQGILNILSTYKKGTESLNEETKTVVNSLLQKTITEAERLQEEFVTTKKELITQFKTSADEIKQLAEDIQAIASEVKDGKDADEEAIIEEVVNRIKIEAPENIVETPESIRNKLQTLEGDNRLDVNFIKGLDIGRLATREELTDSVLRLQNQARFLMNRGGIKSIVAGTNITIDTTDPNNPVISSSGGGGGSGITRVVQSKSTDFTAAAASATDYVYDCTSALTVTLPTAVGNTNLYTIINSSSGTITVATTGGQTINGSSTATLPIANMALGFESNNSNWKVV